MYLISQPELRLIDCLNNELQKDTYSEFTFSIAYAKMSGVNLIRKSFENFKSRKATITAIIGIDQKNTSSNALFELVAVCDFVYIFHCEDLRQTFHPKFYFFDNPNYQSNLIVGSGNLTNGGLINNFEVNFGVELSYQNDADNRIIDSIKGTISSYIKNQGLCKRADSDFIQQLLDSGYIETEEKMRAKLSRDKQSDRRVLFGKALDILIKQEVGEEIKQSNNDDAVDSYGENETMEDLEGVEDADIELNTGFWKKLRKNDVSKTSSPGQIIIPIAFRQHFPPFINQHMTEAGGMQEEVFMNIRFITSSGNQISAQGARAVFYTPAPDHPRQNIDFRFTFRNDTVFDLLDIDDILVFQKTNEEGVDFVVRHIKPNMPEYVAFSGRYNQIV